MKVAREVMEKYKVALSKARQMNWEFLTRRAVEAMHAEQLRRHGGAAGLRD